MVSPTVIKEIISVAVSIILDEEKRTNVIMSISILVSVIFIIILIPAYILLNPIESIKNIFSSEEQEIINSVKNNFGSEYELGNITIKGKLGFPLEHAENVIISAEYGYYDPWNTGKQIKHTGIDLVGIHRDNILAVEKGEVIFAGVDNTGYGNCIEIKHELDGIEIFSFYAHLSTILVEVGQIVEQGYIIGKEGGNPYTDLNAGNSTGHHLHFEIRRSIDYGNDVNPKEYIY